MDNKWTNNWRTNNKTPNEWLNEKIVQLVNINLNNPMLQLKFTWGNACMTVSSNALIPLAILSSLRTLAILRTLITRMMVGLIGKTCPSISSRAMPMMERKTMDTSSWFHLILWYGIFCYWVWGMVLFYFYFLISLENPCYRVYYLSDRYLCSPSADTFIQASMTKIPVKKKLKIFNANSSS